MTWLPIREAAKTGSASKATWERRVASGRWPSYLERDEAGGPGVRMVWVGAVPAELLGDEVAKLRALLEGLVEQLASAKVAGAKLGPPATKKTGGPGRAEARTSSTGAPVRSESGPRLATPTKRRVAAAITEPEVEQLLAQVAASGRGDKSSKKRTEQEKREVFVINFDSSTHERAIRARKKRLLEILEPLTVEGRFKRSRVTGVIAAYCQIDDEVATKLVPFNHPNQRSMKGVTRENYATDMQNGAFEESVVCLMFSEDYFLVNGQHTLQAMIDSGSAYVLKVRLETPQAAVSAVDQARRRSPRDDIKMDGGDPKYAERKAALARILYSRAIKGTLFKSPHASKDQIMSIMDSNPVITEAVRETQAIQRDGKAFLTPRDAGLCYYLANELGPEALELGLDYLRKVSTGNNVTVGDPAIAVRIALQNNLHTQRPRRGYLENEPREQIVRKRVIVLLGLRYTIQNKRRSVIKIASHKIKGEDVCTVLEFLDTFFAGAFVGGVLAPAGAPKRRRRSS